MYRETHEFGVDFEGQNLTLTQKIPAEKEPGKFVVDRKHLILLKQWLDEAAKEAHQQSQAKK